MASVAHGCSRGLTTCPDLDPTRSRHVEFVDIGFGVMTPNTDLGSITFGGLVAPRCCCALTCSTVQPRRGYMYAACNCACVALSSWPQPMISGCGVWIHDLRFHDLRFHDLRNRDPRDLTPEHSARLRARTCSPVHGVYMPKGHSLRINVNAHVYPPRPAQLLPQGLRP